MNVCLIGLTGSGKTSVALMLSESLGLGYVSSGDIARAMSREDPHTAVALERGQMAPEEAMRIRVRAELESAELERGGWILEGFPRDLAQLACLMSWSASLPSFVHLALDPFTVIERLTSRGRSDDTPDAIARRIHHYNEHTVPVVLALEQGGVLGRVDARLDRFVIAREIEELLTR